MNDMKWIPVTERLPERSGEYLVTVTNSEGKISVDRETYFFDGKHNPLAPEKEADFANGYLIYEFPDGFVGWCFYQDDHEECIGSLCEEGRTVLAWMPLPEPYKKDTPAFFNDDDAAHYLLKKHSEMVLKEWDGAARLYESLHKHPNN